MGVVGEPEAGASDGVVAEGAASEEAISEVAASVRVPPWWVAVVGPEPPARKTSRMLSISRVVPTLAATARMASPS